MKKNALTLRQKKIIEILTNPNNTDFITISNIAEKLGLSNRTVLRDMPNVEKWLYENDFNFIKKPGVGLIIDESLENKEFILELLEFENIKKSKPNITINEKEIKVSYEEEEKQKENINKEKSTIIKKLPVTGM